MFLYPPPRMMGDENCDAGAGLNDFYTFPSYEGETRGCGVSIHVSIHSPRMRGRRISGFACPLEEKFLYIPLV